MAKRALLVGINQYLHLPNLASSVDDAKAMKDVLARNDDGTPNYHCRLLTYPGNNKQITRDELREQWELLFQSFPDDILFYFSGHGAPNEYGGSLMTCDGTDEEPGLPMNELLDMANRSRAREVLLILDCCFSGSIGEKPSNRLYGLYTESLIQLREGVTVLAASSPQQLAMQLPGSHSIFTSLVMDALRGGAADVRGNVSAASIYAYVEQALGPWQQRPLYKSHANSSLPMRRCKPAVDDKLLRLLPKYFPEPSSKYAMAPTYERTHESAIEAHVEIFQHFIKYRNAHLLATVGGKHLYYTVLESGAVELTPLGQLYWRLAKEERL